MNNSNQIFDWLDYNNQDELKWAIKYLATKNLSFKKYPRHMMTKDVFTDFGQELKNQLSEAELKLLIHQMKNAKKQRNNREKQRRENRKNYSIVMNENIHEKLKELAGNEPIAHTLEAIINNTYQFKTKLASDLEAKIKTELNRSSKLMTKETHEQELAKLKCKVSIQALELQALLKKLCEYELVFEKINFTPLISKDDEVLIDINTEARKKLIKDNIKKQLGALTRISLKLNNLDIFNEET